MNDKRKVIVIEADMEGASLIDRIEMVQRNPDGTRGEAYEFGCDRLAHDLDAAIRGCFAGGADEVRFEDGHGGGGNIQARHRDPERYPGIARARQVSLNDAASLDGASAYIQLNMHAMAGTLRAFLDHTQSSVTWHDLWIDGNKCGEIAMGAYLAGARGIPYIMMSGDRAAVCEARSLIPGVYTAEVKSARTRNHADCIDGEEAARLIFEAAREAVLHMDGIAPVSLPLPVPVVVEFNRSDYCEQYLAGHPGRTRLDARTLTRQMTRIKSYDDMMP